MSDPRADWDLVETVTGVARLTRVAYGGGQWVSLGVGGVGSAYATTASSAEGPWTVYGDIGIPETTSLVYADGFWVAGGALATSTDPDGSWTVHTGLPDAWEAITVAYGNGSWGAMSGGSVYSAADPSSTWTAETDITPYGQTVVLAIMAYLNGEWVAVLHTSPDDAAHVLTASSLSGSWTEQAIFSGLAGDTDGPAQIVATDEGYFIRFTYTVWYAATLDGTWTKIDQPFDWVAFGDGDYVWTQADIFVSDTIAGAREDVNVTTSDYAWSAVYAADTWVAVGESAIGEGTVWVAGEGGDGWGLLL